MARQTAFLSPLNPLPSSRRVSVGTRTEVTAKARISARPPPPPPFKLPRSTLHLDWIPRHVHSNKHVEWIKPSQPDTFYVAKAVDEKKKILEQHVLSPAAVQWAKHVAAFQEKLVSARAPQEQKSSDFLVQSDSISYKGLSTFNDQIGVGSVKPETALRDNSIMESVHSQQLSDVPSLSDSTPCEASTPALKAKQSENDQSSDIPQEIACVPDEAVTEISAGSQFNSKEQVEVDNVDERITDAVLADSLAERTRIMAERNLAQSKSFVAAGGREYSNVGPLMFATSSGPVGHAAAADHGIDSSTSDMRNFAVSAILLLFVSFCLLLGENFHGMMSHMGNVM